MRRVLLGLLLALCSVATCAAQQYLKQSTATTIKMGPFVDSVDGVTAETGLTISQADIRLSKAGGAFAQTNNVAGATHDENGLYDIPLDTTDTNTLGRLPVFVAESGALQVRQDYFVVPANVFDSIASTDKLQVDAIEISGDSAAADNLEAANEQATTWVETTDDAEALIEAGSSGDLFILAAGTHTTTATITVPAGVHVVGLGAEVTIVLNSTDGGFVLNTGCTLRDLTSRCTTGSGKPVLTPLGSTDTTIENCNTEGVTDTVVIQGQRHVVRGGIHKSELDGFLFDATDVVLEDLSMVLVGTQASPVNAIQGGSLNRLIMRNCTISVDQPISTTSAIAGVIVGGDCVLDNVTMLLSHSHAASAGDIYGVRVTGDGRVVCNNVTIRTVDGGSVVNTYALWGETGSIVYSGGDFDIATINGSVTAAGAVEIRTEVDANSTQLAKLGTPAGASISADNAAIKAETALIAEDTGTTLPASLATLTADVVLNKRTFFADTEGVQADNTISLATWSTGTITLAANFGDVDKSDDEELLNPGTTLSTVDSVTVTNNADQSTVTTSNLELQQNRMAANYDVAPIASAGTFTVVVRVTSTDGQPLTLKGTLVVE